MSQNFVIPILMLINRINLSLLKGTFYKRVLRRIRWFDSKSIINGMTCPSYQLLEIILTKINFLNSPDYLGIFFYLIFTIIISKILLIYLYLYPHADIREKINYIPKRNRNKNKDYVTYVVKGKDLTEEEINEHGLYDISIITKEESDFKSFAIYVDDFNPLFNEKMIKNAKRSLVEQNAGGSSDISEAWSIHHLSKKNKIKNANVRWKFHIILIIK